MRWSKAGGTLGPGFQEGAPRTAGFRLEGFHLGCTRSSERWKRKTWVLGQGTHSHRRQSPPNADGLRPGFQLPAWLRRSSRRATLLPLSPAPGPLPLPCPLPPALCPLAPAPCPVLCAAPRPRPSFWNNLGDSELHKGRRRQGETQDIWLMAQLLRTGDSPGVRARRPQGKPSGGARDANELLNIPPGWT